MGEDISQLMDGELDSVHADRVCAKLADGSALETWVAYHVIGDALRRDAELAPGFHDRFRARLTSEPTVLAPSRPAAKPALVPWAIAASVAAVAVVGWMGLHDLSAPPVATVAQAPGVEKATLVVAKPAQASGRFNDYLMVHQAYSPATAMQGVRPYLRTVAETGPEAR